MTTQESGSTPTFKCPTCFQVYAIGGKQRVTAIREHMRKHGKEVDSRWVKRRMR